MRPAGKGALESLYFDWRRGASRAGRRSISFSHANGEIFSWDDPLRFLQRIILYI
jgi:hypothetical protein